MPNWCANSLEVSNENKAKIDLLENFLTESNGKAFFDFFVDPADGEDWYTYNIQNYGCKWNCDTNDWERTDDHTIRISFDSPWSPPIQLYENMLTNDYEVYAEFYESGIGFVGKYEYGEEQSWSYHNNIDEVPEDLIENWCLREELENLEEEDDEHSRS
jgi:hypothetical protein